MKNKSRVPVLLRIAAFVLLAFALITLFMSGSVIFDLFDIRAKEGNYVLFVVVLNFVCGILYLISSYGMFSQKKWTAQWLLLSVGILILSFSSLLWHINFGGVYEAQTVKAMIFRIGLTAAFTVLAWRSISKKQNNISQ